MTTTLDRTIPADIAYGTRIVNRDDVGQTGQFLRWADQISTDGGASLCAFIHYDSDSPGRERHICALREDWQLDTDPVSDNPANAELTEYREQAALAGQRIADLVREKTNAEVQVEALRAENERMANTIVELREHVELRVNERDQAQRAVSAYETRWDRTWERLEREAESRGWCSEYDDIAEELGGPRRYQQIAAYCTVSVTTELDSDDLLGPVGDLTNLDEVSCSDTATVEWCFDLTLADRRARNGECAHDHEWDMVARNILNRQGIRFSSVDTSDRSCENCT